MSATRNQYLATARFHALVAREFAKRGDAANAKQALRAERLAKRRAK